MGAGAGGGEITASCAAERPRADEAGPEGWAAAEGESNAAEPSPYASSIAVVRAICNETRINRCSSIGVVGGWVYEWVRGVAVLVGVSWLAVIVGSV